MEYVALLRQHKGKLHLLDPIIHNKTLCDRTFEDYKFMAQRPGVKVTFKIEIPSKNVCKKCLKLLF